MNKRHPLKEIIRYQKQGIPLGICSICSANEYVIEAAVEKALTEGTDVLIEATANQVNQFGGYTGMKPADFRDFAFSIAKRASFPSDKIILGGDHLGPLTWKSERSDTAMEKSCELIKQYILAGFTKIHIDTSMRLADDPEDCRLDTGVTAERGAVLCMAAEEAFNELKRFNPDAVNPVYAVGSEVPIPGGSQEAEEGIIVTEVKDFHETVEAFKKAFYRRSLKDAWENVVAVVVQPGVEFGDDSIHEYKREDAEKLCSSLKQYPGLVFEGHSTDYQTAAALKQMVEDGIAILKVGPALTFAMREALFMLCHMEDEIARCDSSIEPSNFIDILDAAMIRQPENWKKHYHGSEGKIRFARKYSLSDRCRYYLPAPEVRDSMNALIKNLKSVKIPLTLVSQFLPVQHNKIKNGLLKNDPESLIKDRVINVLDEYYYAVLPDA